MEKEQTRRRVLDCFSREMEAKIEYVPWSEMIKVFTEGDRGTGGFIHEKCSRRLSPMIVVDNIGTQENPKLVARCTNIRCPAFRHLNLAHEG